MAIAPAFNLKTDADITCNSFRYNLTVDEMPPSISIKLRISFSEKEFLKKTYKHGFAFVFLSNMLVYIE